MPDSAYDSPRATEIGNTAGPTRPQYSRTAIRAGSINSFLGYPTFSAYCASKHGLIGLTSSVSAELAPHGIRVNLICPGIIDTPMHRRARQLFGDEAYDTFLQNSVHMKRAGLPGEIARSIALLCSDDASYITGTTLTPDGGFHLTVWKRGCTLLLLSVRGVASPGRNPGSPASYPAPPQVAIAPWAYAAITIASAIGIEGLNVKSFARLYEQAAARKGGEAALEALVTRPTSAAALARIADDRWLAGMARAVLRTGLNWSVVENKWPGIEAAFHGFSPRGVAFLSDDDLDVLMKDKRVIRHWRKLQAIRTNAQYLVELAAEHGTAAKYFAQYPSTDYVGLLEDLRKRAAFLGGTTGQYFLREMGKDSFLLSKDVVAALQREGVFTGSPTSKSSLKAIQAAFNEWLSDGGQSLTRVSRVLAFTVG